MLKEYLLGQQLEVEKELFRVIRIVQDSQALHREADGTEYIIRESYVELKGLKGEIEFITLQSEKLPYIGDKSKILAPENIPWKGGR